MFVSSQAISGWSTTAGVGESSPQVNASNSSVSRAAGSHFRSSSRVGAGLAGAVGRGLGTGVGSCGSGRRLVAVGDGEAVASGASPGCSAGSSPGSTAAGAASSANTLRKYSWAVWPTISTSSSAWTFGTETTIWRSPLVGTSVSPTPIESTRCWMIVRASSRLVGSTDPSPVTLEAVSVIVVPPRRSRPSLGV